MSKFGGKMGALLGCVEFGILKSTEKEQSRQKCRSGCHKIWKRMRSSRDSKLETASLRDGRKNDPYESLRDNS